MKWSAFSGQHSEEEGFNLVIMEHNHRPSVVEFNGGTYVNLSNWMGKFE